PRSSRSPYAFGFVDGCRTQMPAELMLELSEERLRNPTEIPDLHVAVLDVVSDPPRKDVIDEGIRDAKVVTSEHFGQFLCRIRIRHRRAELRLRMLGDQLLRLTEVASSILQHHPEHLPRPAVVDHQFQRPAGFEVARGLLEDPLRMRRVMDNSK